MSSLRRTISSRAMVKGPVTPAGKCRSSRNATRHGLMAKIVVLENESREAFDSLQSEFVARFAPTDAVELGLVEEMLSAFWRQRRAWAIETRIMDNATATQPPDEDELTRLAGGFTSIAAQPPLELIHRYETRLHRIFQRALANLIQMRSLPELDPPENIKLPNDPSPISEHPPTPETEVEPAPCAEIIKLPFEPSPISGQCATPETAVEPPPCAEIIKLPNDPSPISGHPAQSVVRTRGDPPLRTVGFTRCSKSPGRPGRTGPPSVGALSAPCATEARLQVE